MLDRNDPGTSALIRAVSGQYSIEREVGRGGMGIVYLGRDEQLERPVAIKTLPPHLAADPQVRRRFLTEARTAGALSHPNIVPVYVAAERDEVVYFAMRYINGESLAERILRAGALPAGEVMSVLRQLASALGYAHDRGIVHRDIKAENVLFDSETGRAMLTDFGIARVAQNKSLTATGTVLGSVHYMSPEQVSGDTLDGRSDLYSLAVLAFFALSGRFPFERPTASAIVVAHVTSTPAPLCSVAPAVPAALGAVVDRLLAKAPGDRYENAKTLREALDAISIDSSSGRVPGNEVALPAHAPAQKSGVSGVAATQSTTANVTTPQPEVMSSADAERVWARAAELQANTGMIVPPSQFELSQLAVPSDTVGFDAAIVRASAVDAGIDARYVDRALAERTRAAAVSQGSGGTGLSPVTDNAGTGPNWFMGARAKIELETAFDGELSDIGFEEVADEMRRGLGELVTVSAVGRTLTVTSDSGGGQRHGVPRRVQIHLTSRRGRTTVRAFEDLKHSATALFVGLTMGGGVGAGSAVMGAVLAATQNPALGAAALGATVVGAYGIARAVYKRTVRKREQQLRDVLQRVVVRSQESIAAPPEAHELPVFPRR